MGAIFVKAGSFCADVSVCALPGELLDGTRGQVHQDELFALETLAREAYGDRLAKTHILQHSAQEPANVPMRLGLAVQKGHTAPRIACGRRHRNLPIRP